MTALRAAAQLALEFVEFLWREAVLNDYAEAKREETELALRAALAQPTPGENGRMHADRVCNAALAQQEQAPPRREWEGLTDEEIDARWRTACADERPRTTADLVRAFARAVEQALKEKNT